MVDEACVRLLRRMRGQSILDHPRPDDQFEVRLPSVPMSVEILGDDGGGRRRPVQIERNHARNVLCAHPDTLSDLAGRLHGPADVDGGPVSEVSVMDGQCWVRLCRSLNPLLDEWPERRIRDMPGRFRLFPSLPRVPQDTQQRER